MLSDPSTWIVPTIRDVEEAREDRDIRVTHFSYAIGYSSGSGWGNVVRRGHCSLGRMQLAVEALEFYDENEYLPVPEELDTAVPCRS